MIVSTIKLDYTLACLHKRVIHSFLCLCVKHEEIFKILTQCFLQAISSAEESDDESVTSLQQQPQQQQQQQRKTAKTTTTARRPSDAGHIKSTRSASSDSNTSTETSTGSSNAVRSTGAPFTTEEVKQKYLSRGGEAPQERTRKSSTGSTKEAQPQKQFQSRFLHNKTATPPATTAKDNDETETSSEEETESEEDSDDNTTTPKPDTKEMAKTDIGALLARSANARDSSTENARRSSRDESSSTYTRSRYTAPKEDSPPRSRYGRRTSAVQDDEPPRYGYTSRFLNKSKSSAALQPEEEDHRYGSTLADDSDSKYPSSGRSRYMALKERRQRLARSKSSQQFGDDEDIEEQLSPTSSNPTAYLASRGYGSAASSGYDLSRSRSSHALKSRDNSPDRSSNATEKDGAALSSWARYLKNKYGNRNSGKDKESTNSGSPGSSSSTTARRLSLGLPLRSSTELGSSDDDQKNMQGSPTTPPTAATAADGEYLQYIFIAICRHLLTGST